MIHMFSSVSQNIKFFFLSNSLYYGGFDIVGAFLAILITEKVAGGSPAIVGYLVSYGMIIRAILEIIISPHLRKFSWSTKQRIVTSGYLIYGVITIMMGFSVSIAQVFFFQTIISLIDAICYPLKWSIFTKIIDSNNQELEWSLEDVLSTLASATLAALGGYLTNWYGLTVIFIFFGISYSLSGLSFYFIKMKRHQHIF